MSLLRDSSIGNKLLIINVVSMGLAMLILVLSITAVMFVSSRNSLLEDVNNQAYILGESLAPTVLFGDFDSADALSKAVPPHIEYVIVLDRAGKKFISFPHHAEIRADVKVSAFEQYFSEIHMSYPLKVNDQPVGMIQMGASLGRIYHQLTQFLLFTFFSLLVSTGVGIVMLRKLQPHLLSPIVGLTKSMRLISNTDNYSLRFHLNNKDELGELAAGFNSMLKKIQSNQVKLDAELVRRKEAEDRLQQLAFYDSVTHLPNRHFFKERLESVVVSTLRHHSSCSVMLIDLDDFKNVNDTLGHHVGDELLLAVSDRINKALRGSDVLCRIGGDEFAMILENTQDITQVTFIAERVIGLLTQPFMLHGKEVFIGASIGISFCPADTTDIPTLLRNADNAMYSAKNCGKNHYQMYQQNMEHKSMKRFTLENALRRALELNELFLVYQPIVQISTHEIVGFEALVRWNNAELGVVYPSDFIPIAEETGLILPIGEFVVTEACSQMQHWRDACGFEGMLSVNLSGRQLFKPDAVERIVTAVKSTGFPYDLLNFELTESILMDHSKETFDKLEALNHLGFSISIDDFGTGYSSMSYLKRYPINTLKIDRSFISDLPRDPNDIAISKAIIALGKNLAMKIVAEGVEAEEQLKFLQACGCDLAQGFFFSEPMTAEQTEDFILTQVKSKKLVLDTV